MRAERKQEEKKQNNKKRFADILAIVYIIAVAAFIISVFWVNVLPIMYFAILVLLLALTSVPILRSLLGKNSKTRSGRESKKPKKKTAASAAAIIVILITSIGTYYMGSTLDFFGKISGASQTHDFYVIVRTSSGYESLKDIDGKTVGVMDNADDVYTKAQGSLKEKVNVSFESMGSFDVLAKALLNGDTDVIFMNSAYYDMALEEVDGFTKDSVKILEDINVKVKSEAEAKTVNVTKEPFNIYVSGLDTTGSIGNTSRSDVNMILTVNPKTRTILLTSIPRDYYVKLASKGAMDKLTHSGLYGIDETTSTVEDLLGIDINYHIKVNFTTVVKLVDTLGGITVDSDYSFSAGGYNFQAGQNYLNGEAALAFSRERYSFLSGDNQRVKNQQAVITGIINKCASSASILTNYTGILNSVEDNLQTNMSQKDMTSLVKMQLGDMSGWTIKQCSLTGSGKMTPVYSIPNYNVYVMVPNQNSISEAKSQIASVMGQ